MIPASFSYHRPAVLAEALKILSDHGDDARVLAGGHSLIPMMKMRMANIPHLIDLQDIAQILHENVQILAAAEHITFNFASASSGGKRPSPQSGATTRRSRSI